MKTIKDLCKEYGYSQTGLAQRFGIPLRTVQNWHGGQREPAPYVVPMMDEILKAEKEDWRLTAKLNLERIGELEEEIAELNKVNNDIGYILLGVMHSVDKWLDGAELEQDEVNRAATMREKTLRIVEELTAKAEELENELSWVDARPTMYVSKECPNCGRIRVEHYTNGKHVCEKCHWCIEENQYRESIFKYQ